MVQRLKTTRSAMFHAASFLEQYRQYYVLIVVLAQWNLALDNITSSHFGPQDLVLVVGLGTDTFIRHSEC